MIEESCEVVSAFGACDGWVFAADGFAYGEDDLLKLSGDIEDAWVVLCCVFVEVEDFTCRERGFYTFDVVDCSAVED